MMWKKAVCVSNEYGNTNFTKGKIYDWDSHYIATDWGGMHIYSENELIPNKMGEKWFAFGLCVFKVISE